MPIQDQTGVRPLETVDDWVETRLEALGFIFHGAIPHPDGTGLSSQSATPAGWARPPSHGMGERTATESGIGASPRGLGTLSEGVATAVFSVLQADAEPPASAPDPSVGRDSTGTPRTPL